MVTMTKTKHQNRYLRRVLRNLARNDSKTKEVILNDFAIGSENEKMAQLAMSLVSNTNIKVLCLNNCDVSSKGAHLLAYALGRNKSLDHVWLNHNKIGSSGADAIATALSRNQSLLTLSLANNSIGNHGGKALIKALSKNNTLTDVFVENNRMSSRVEDEINRLCYYGDESDGDGDEVQEYQYSCDHSAYDDYDLIDYDCGTVTGSIVSQSFVRRTLGSIKEVEYESDSDSIDDSDSTASSTLSDDEPMDLDFTCFYQKKKEGRFAKLKGLLRRKKVKPGN